MKIYVLTSNQYLRCLPPFAYLFNKFWSPDQPVTIVGYEQRPSGLPSNFDFLSLGCQTDYTWSSGALRFLELVNDDIFILLLEDYFLSISAYINGISAFWAYMESHTEIVKIDLTDDRLKVPHKDYKETIGKLPMVQANDDALFQTSLQAAIWRRDFMRRYLDAGENPWQFEKRGTQRVIQDRRVGAFNGLILGSKRPPMTYINAIGGEGSMAGIWALKRFPVWMIHELKGLM